LSKTCDILQINPELNWQRKYWSKAYIMSQQWCHKMDVIVGIRDIILCHAYFPLSNFLSSNDNTATGHVLGAPQRWNAAPERNMSPASMAVMRMILHMSMYLGAMKNAQVFRPFHNIIFSLSQQGPLRSILIVLIS